MMSKFPWQSPFATFDNRPIATADPTGGEGVDNIHIYSDGKAVIIPTNSKSDTYYYHDANDKILGQKSVLKDSYWGNWARKRIPENAQVFTPATNSTESIQSSSVNIKADKDPSDLQILGGVAKDIAVNEVLDYAKNLIHNEKTWFDPWQFKKYSLKFPGNQYTVLTVKSSKSVSRAIPVIGWGIGGYNAYSINDDYRAGDITTGGMLIEQGSNLFATFGGTAGAGWGVGWELGKHYGPQTWDGDPSDGWIDDIGDQIDDICGE